MIQLQPRDQEILRCCYEHGFLLMKQVGRYFFKNVSRRESYRRIQELIEAGLLRREPVIAFGSLQVLRATKLGASVAQSVGSQEGLPYSQSLDLVTLAHDSIVLSVRLRLCELWDAEWQPEAAIKLEKPRHLPDGVLNFPSGKRFVVEIEHTQKERSRFQQLLRHWRDEPSQPFVLYVATSEALHRFIKKELSSASPETPALLTLWPELETGIPTVWSTRGELDLFNRKTL